MPESKLLLTLQTLQKYQVQFIVVGGVAAALNGAPVQTYDLDLVYSPDAANIQSLLNALTAMEAIFRLQPQRRLKPAATHLCAGGHLNLLTRYGPLDLLGTIGRNLGYEELLSHSTELDIGPGIHVRVLDLETLISVKEELGGDKDVAVLPVLRQTLNEIKRRKDSESS